MHKLNIKPLSVNQCYQGRRFKTQAYKDYEEKVLHLLRGKKLDLPPAGDLEFHMKIGVIRSFDVDNGVKNFLDILQKKYRFNDNRIVKMILHKDIVKKGKEYIQFDLFPAK